MKQTFLQCLSFIFISCLLSSAFAVDMLLPEDFHKAMVSDRKDQKAYNEFVKSVVHKELFALVQELYKQFPVNAEKRRSAQPIIPKIIHQIWIGPHSFPKKTLAWQKTWTDLHPGWEYKLWTNEDVKKLNLKNRNLFDKATNWGEKADILRYEILYQFGGLYVDVDFEGLKPFDELHHICDFYAGIHAVPLLFHNKLRINNGLIAARPGHPILEQALERLHEFVNEPKVSRRTGPDFLTTIIENVLPHSLVNGSVDMIFPSNFFYPSGPFDGPGYVIESGKAYVQPETMGVHYYTAFWINPPKDKPSSSASKPNTQQTPEPQPVVISTPVPQTVFETKPTPTLQPKPSQQPKPTVPFKPAPKPITQPKPIKPKPDQKPLPYAQSKKSIT